MSKIKKKIEVESIGLGSATIIRTPTGKLFVEAKCNKCDAKISLTIDQRLKDNIEKKGKVRLICQDCKYPMAISSKVLDDFIRHFENKK